MSRNTHYTPYGRELWVNNGLKSAHRRSKATAHNSWRCWRARMKRGRPAVACLSVPRNAHDTFSRHRSGEAGSLPVILRPGTIQLGELFLPLRGPGCFQCPEGPISSDRERQVADIAPRWLPSPNDGLPLLLARRPRPGPRVEPGRGRLTVAAPRDRPHRRGRLHAGTHRRRHFPRGACRWRSWAGFAVRGMRSRAVGRPAFPGV